MITFSFTVIVGLLLFFSHVKVAHKKTLRKAKKFYKMALRIDCEEKKISFLKTFNKQPFVFEEMVLLALKSKGYVVKRNKRYTGDGGIDGVAYRGCYRFIIQCKCYGRGQYIKTNDVVKLQNACVKKNDRGLFIHTARTPKSTLKAFRGSTVEIVSGDSLVELFS